MQMQNRGCRHGGIHFILLAAEGCGNEHAHLHEAGIPHFNADLAGAQIRIEDRKDIIDSSLKTWPGYAYQRDLRGVAGMNGGKIVFIDIADDPHS